MSGRCPRRSPQPGAVGAILGWAGCWESWLLRCPLPYLSRPTPERKARDGRGQPPLHPGPNLLLFPAPPRVRPDGTRGSVRLSPARRAAAEATLFDITQILQFPRVCCWGGADRYLQPILATVSPHSSAFLSLNSPDLEPSTNHGETVWPVFPGCAPILRPRCWPNSRPHCLRFRRSALACACPKAIPQGSEKPTRIGC